MLLSLLLAAAGTWHITDRTSQLDGARSYHALLLADGTVANIINTSERPALGLDCDKSGLFVAVDWPDFVEQTYDQTHVTVAWKIDDGVIRRTTWLAGDRMVALKGKEASELMTQLATSKRFVISVPDKHGGQEAVFTTDGAAPIVETIKGMRCG